MAAKLAGDARVQVGRPRKHAEGWNNANKRICISNATFIKWRKLREDFKLVNDDAVACYLLSAVMNRSAFRSNEQAENSTEKQTPRQTQHER